MRDWRGVVVVLALVVALVYLARLEPNSINMMVVGCMCGVLGSALQRHKQPDTTGSSMTAMLEAPKTLAPATSQKEEESDAAKAP